MQHVAARKRSMMGEEKHHRYFEKQDSESAEPESPLPIRAATDRDGAGDRDVRTQLSPDAQSIRG